MRQRSSVFFQADVSDAADIAAHALGEHGLTPEQVEQLATELEETIRDFFSKVRDAES